MGEAVWEIPQTGVRGRGVALRQLWIDNLHVCPECDFHGKLTAHERIAFTLDADTFEEIGASIAPSDPLGFACGYGNYKDKVQ